MSDAHPAPADRPPTEQALVVAALARIAYVVVIAIATLTNLGFDPSTTDVGLRLARALHPSFHLSDAVDAVRNVALFAGLGAVWVATSRQPRLRRPLLHGTIAGAILSTTVEGMQLFSPVRFASIMDVASNTVGAALGGLAVIALVRVARWERRREPFGGIPALLVAASYAGAVALEAFAPLFRPATLPDIGGSIGARIGRALQAVDPATLHHVPAMDLVLFAPAGLFLAVALIGVGIPPVAAWLLVSVAGWGSMLAIEIAHGVLGIPVHLGAVVAHGIALILGSAAGALWFRGLALGIRLRRGERRFVAAYAALVALWSWRPFRLDLSPAAMAEQFSATHVVPLRDIVVHSTVLSVTDVLTQACLFFPLGLLLAAEPLGRRGWRGGLWPAVLLSIMIEVAKIPIRNRSFDVTHILIECGAAGVGWLLVCRPVRLPPGG